MKGYWVADVAARLDKTSGRPIPQERLRASVVGGATGAEDPQVSRDPGMFNPPKWMVEQNKSRMALAGSTE